MDNTTQQKSTSLQEEQRFTIIQRQVHNPHPFQFYFDYGTTSGGLWAQLGINDIEYVVGYPPVSVRNQTHRPSHTRLQAAT